MARRRWSTLLALVVGSLAAEGANPRPSAAARPFITDDARVVAPGGCQVETWGQLSKAGDEFWFLPACNFIADVELTAGFALLPSASDSGPGKPSFTAQAKTILYPLEPGGFGVGLAAGTFLNGAPGAEQQELLGNAYAYVPATLLLADDRAQIHTNIGLRYESDDGAVRATWGIAGELVVCGPLTAVAEMYGSSHEDPFAQFGVRVALIPGLLQFDSTYGLQFGGPSDEHWVTVGLRFTPPLFLH